MSILIDITQQRELTEAINEVNIYEPFLMTAFFGNKQFTDAEIIDKQSFRFENGISVAVNKASTEPNLIENGKANYGTITLPKFWDKKVFTVSEFRAMQVVSGYDVAQLEKQAAINRLNEIEDMKKRVDRADELMAATALLTGACSSGADSFDFNFDAAKHKVDISGNATLKWTGTKPTIMANLETWAGKVAENSGMAANICVMGTEAWAAAAADTNLLAELNANNNRIGALDRTIPTAVGATYKGKLAGMEIYVYSQKYGLKSNKTYTQTEMFDPKKVLIANRNSKGFVHQFGTVYRFAADGKTLIPNRVNYLLTPIVNQNNTALTWEIESRNIPCIWDANALVVATVIN